MNECLYRFVVVFVSGSQTRECNFYASDFFAASVLAREMVGFLFDHLNVVYRVVSITEMSK